jgi:hypothetical protein
VNVKVPSDRVAVGRHDPPAHSISAGRDRIDDGDHGVDVARIGVGAQTPCCPDAGTSVTRARCPSTGSLKTRRMRDGLAVSRLFAAGSDEISVA